MQTKHPMLEAFIKELDAQINTVLRGRTLSQAERQAFMTKLITKADALGLTVNGCDELLQELTSYVEAKFGTSPATVTICGETYAISPVMAPDQQGIVGNLIPQTKDMFRPFLIRQIYSYLVGKAFLGHTTTYENIANEFGLPNKGNQLGSTLSPLLSSIYEFCVKHHQPLLTVIVVRKSGELKDLPGNGFWALYNKHPIIAVETVADRREYTRSLQKQVFEYWAGLGQ